MPASVRRTIIEPERHYVMLQAGDVRQSGDEWHALKCYNIPLYAPEPEAVDGWRPVRLIGHALLHSDLIGYEYRRLLTTTPHG